MRNNVTPEITPAALVFSSGRRHTLDLDTVDCALLASALKFAITTREGAKLIGTHTDHLPAAEAREAELLRILDQAQASEGANGSF